MAEVTEYKCPNCGNGIVFDSTLQKMTCSHCGSSFDAETLKEYDASLRTEPEDKQEWTSYDTDSGNGDWKEGEQESMAVYICNSCGGEIVGDATLGATFCPYCGSPVVMHRQFSGILRPDYVLPFQLDKEAAKAALWHFTEKKPLLSKTFRAEQHIDSIQGVYVPFWLFNCNTDSSITFRATRIRHWSDTRYYYTETKHYRLLRDGTMGFVRVPVDGSSKMPDPYMEAIEPFDYSKMVDFQTAYLSGYLAQKFDVDAKASEPRANERIRESVINQFEQTTHGYQTCIRENTNIRIEGGEVRYALLPVWMLNSNYRGKTYTFAMNGQTGKLAGELPVNRGRWWAWFAGITAGIMLIIALGMFELGIF